MDGQTFKQWNKKNKKKGINIIADTKLLDEIISCKSSTVWVLGYNGVELE